MNPQTPESKDFNIVFPGGPYDQENPGAYVLPQQIYQGNSPELKPPAQPDRLKKMIGNTAVLALSASIVLGAALIKTKEQQDPLDCDTNSAIEWSDFPRDGLTSAQAIEMDKLSAIPEDKLWEYEDKILDSDNPSEAEAIIQEVFSRYDIDFTLKLDDADTRMQDIKNASFGILQGLNILPKELVKNQGGMEIILRDMPNFGGRYVPKNNGDNKIRLDTYAASDNDTVVHEFAHATADILCSGDTGNDPEMSNAAKSAGDISSQDERKKMIRDYQYVDQYASRRVAEDFAESTSFLLNPEANRPTIYDCLDPETQITPVCDKFLLILRRLGTVEPKIMDFIARYPDPTDY